jgi:type IV secretory pathway VirJ component
MARRFSLVLLILSLAPAASWAAPESFKFGRFGAVPVVHPQGEPSQVVLLFSGDHGIGERETAMAQALAASGALVFEVDLQRYFALQPPKGARLYPAVELEALGQMGQKEMGLATYRPPVLVGTGLGASMVYVALAEAPEGIFTGGISDGFCATIPNSRFFARGNSLSWDKSWEGPGILLTPDSDIETPWIVLETPVKTECAAGPASAFTKQIPSVRTLPVPAVPAGAAPGEALKSQLAQALGILAEKHRQAEAARNARGELKDLPVNEVKPEGKEKDALAVILTGDGGYVGLDIRMGNQLAARGVPVVGLSSLDYYWKPRDLEGASRDLARILEHYLAAWHKSRAIVVGYSQGADVAPFLVGRLPAPLRAKVGLVALIGPDGEALFDLHPDGWISERPAGLELPVPPEIPKLKGTPTLCVYAAKEKTSICKDLAPGAATLVEVPGDHRYAGDNAAVMADRFLAEAGLAPAPPKTSKAPKPAPAKPRPGGGQKKGRGPRP